MYRQMRHTILDIPCLHHNRHTDTRHRGIVCDDEPRDVAIVGDAAGGDVGNEVSVAIYYGYRLLWRPIARDALLRSAAADVRTCRDTIPLLRTYDAPHKTPLARLGNRHNESDISSARTMLLELVCRQRLRDAHNRVLLRTDTSKWFHSPLAHRRCVIWSVGDSGGDGRMLGNNLSIGQILSQRSCPRGDAFYHSDDSTRNSYAANALVECDSTIAACHTRIITRAADVHQDETQHNAITVASPPSDGGTEHHRSDFYVVLEAKSRFFGT